MDSCSRYYDDNNPGSDVMLLESPEAVIQTTKQSVTPPKPKHKLEFSLKWSKKTKSRPKVEFSPIIEKGKVVAETREISRIPSPPRQPAPKQGLTV